MTVGSIRVYQGLLSRGRVSTCPMEPSCSQYAVEAFSQRGFFQGSFATTDRLQRCSHDLRRYARVDDGSRSRYYDSADGGSAPLSSPTVDPPITRTTAPSNDSSPDDADRLIAFARRLHMDGDHERAVTEYRRLLSYFPESRHRSEATAGVFRCHYSLKRYAEAVRWREQALQQGSFTESEAAETALWAGAALYRMGNRRRARQVLGRIDVEPELRGRLVLMTALTHAADGDWSQAEATLRELRSPATIVTRAEVLAQLCSEARQVRPRKPAVAGVLAVVPGLGYLYDGYPESALAALIVNGLFMAATYEAFKNDDTALGVVLGTFGLGWYGGNIYGSVVTAHRRNLATQEGLLLRFDIGFRF